MAGALAIAPALGGPADLLPLAVGTIYGSANDRPGTRSARAVRVLAPAAAGAVGLLLGIWSAGSAFPAALGIVVAAAFAAGLIGAFGRVASAMGLQIPALTALGRGLPATATPGWVESLLFLAGSGAIVALAALAPPVRDAKGRLWEELRLAGRHLRGRLRGGAQAGLRVAACAAAAVLLARWVTVDRGYWILLTVALVVKPETGPVAARALHRGVGTLIGVAAAAVLLAVAGGHLGCAAVAVGATAIVPWAAARSYGALTAVIAPAVFALLQLTGGQASGLVGWRLLDTLLGLAIAVILGHSWRPRRRLGGLRGA